MLSFTLVLLAVWITPIDSGAVQLTNENLDKLIAEHEVVFINFYADWCRFSQILAPVFDEAADKVAPSVQPGQVLFGKVDCDRETAIASRFHISKYPTLKLLRIGQVAKREYRGQRSAEALANFVKEQLADPVKEITSLSDTNITENKKRSMVGFFEKKDAPEYHMYRKVSMNLRDDCDFFAAFGEVGQTYREQGRSLVFKPARVNIDDSTHWFPGQISSLDDLNTWATEKCIPIVREITFENAEELTEEGLPFLILFHHPDDHDIVEKYSKEVNTQLLSDKASINFLTADGVKFAHPLHHLGKSQKDLPLIAIDSFRHMYLFPDIKQMTVPGKLKHFVDDLYSGKLHREFHYGPDPNPQEVAHSPDNDLVPTPQGHQGGPTEPPESTFKKLAPSKNRYTLLRDEL